MKSKFKFIDKKEMSEKRDWKKRKII